jgi:hypothetical protein
MAAMEELEVHSKVRPQERARVMVSAADRRLIYPTVLLRPLGPRQIRAYHLLEHSTAQEVAELRHLQASRPVRHSQYP